MSEILSRRSIGILGLGRHVPARLLTNAEVEERAGIPTGDIEKKTGVKSRYIAGEDDSASGLSVPASLEAIANAGISAEDLTSIIACTFTADYVMPALACKVHQLIGAKNACAFDIMANCTAFQVGLNLMADRLAADPTQKFGLVLGTALQSRFVNWQDPDSCMYFGDGVGAAVLGPVPDGFGFVAHEVYTNSSVYEAVRIRGGGSSFPLRPSNIEEGLNFYEINGMEVWKQVVQHQPIVIRRALNKAGLGTEDVDFFIFHQANLNLINFLMGKLKLPLDKTHSNVERFGNTAEASMAMALAEAVELKKIKHGDIVVISGVGAGFTYGASVMKWWAP